MIQLLPEGFWQLLPIVLVLGVLYVAGLGVSILYEDEQAEEWLEEEEEDD